MEKKTIGALIAALRKAHGMTQKDLAERLHVSDKTVSRWERDEGEPDLSTLPVLAEIFGVTCDELLRGERAKMTDPFPAGESARGAREKKHLLQKARVKFKNQSLITLSVGLLGLMAALVLNFGFLRSIAGFFVGTALIATAAVLEVIFLNTALSQVVDADLTAEEAGTYRHGIVKTAERTYLAIAEFLAVILPLIFIDHVYAGLGPSSWMLWAAILGTVAFVLWLLTCLWVESRLLEAGAVALSEKKQAAFFHNRKLYKNCVGFTALTLALTCAFHAFGGEMIWSAQNLAGSIRFEDVESFVEFMEQDVPYEGNPAPMGQAVAPLEEPAYNVDHPEEPLYWDQDGNPISQDEARTRHLVDANDQILATFVQRNETVSTWRYHPGDGTVTPIEVICHEAQKDARNKSQTINLALTALYPLEVLAGISVAAIKRKK